MSIAELHLPAMPTGVPSIKVMSWAGGSYRKSDFAGTSQDHIRIARHTGGIGRAEIFEKLKWTTLWPKLYRPPDVT